MTGFTGISQSEMTAFDVADGSTEADFEKFVAGLGKKMEEMMQVMVGLYSCVVVEEMMQVRVGLYSCVVHVLFNT
jgi:hypothetical protein